MAIAVYILAKLTQKIPNQKRETSTHLYYVVNGLIIMDLASLPVSDMEHYITKQEQ
jgi:hypothetical protein